ncbi:MAG: tRNA lysidine(34) synthetase TilS [Bacteroidales bacterium]|nr:tRNA lysidine(34) synthetase TilS [Bacteroidales bacterium]
MEKQVAKYINSQNLFSRKDKILIALSGGCDSVALTHLLEKLNYKITLAHCNFNLRAHESDTDELFVKKLAEKLKIQLFTKSFETKEFADSNNFSIEEAARILRYNWFEEIRLKESLDYIATAHHLDDKIETFFINLIAGTGIKGIRSIKEKNNKIVRPLLFAKKNEIELWCKKNSIEYRTDKSNYDTKFIRNKLRHKVIPIIKEINPSFSDTMLKNFDIFSEFEKIYNNYVHNAANKIISYRNNLIFLNIEQLKREDAPISSLFEILTAYGFNSAQTINIFKHIDTMQSGKIFISESYRLIKDRAHLIIKKNTKNNNTEYQINSVKKHISSPLPLKIDIQPNTPQFNILKEKNIAYFDADKVKFPLILRNKKKGDYFYPFGMKGKKPLSDYFTDIKLNIFEKEECYLLVSGKDILWIIGYRTDDRYKITEKTKRVLIIKQG